GCPPSGPTTLSLFWSRPVDPERPNQQPILFRNSEPALPQFSVGGFGGPVLRNFCPRHVYVSTRSRCRCHFSFTRHSQPRISEAIGSSRPNRVWPSFGRRT